MNWKADDPWPSFLPSNWLWCLPFTSPSLYVDFHVDSFPLEANAKILVQRFGKQGYLWYTNSFSPDAAHLSDFSRKSNVLLDRHQCCRRTECVGHMHWGQVLLSSLSSSCYDFGLTSSYLSFWGLSLHRWSFSRFWCGGHIRSRSITEKMQGPLPVFGNRFGIRTYAFVDNLMFIVLTDVFPSLSLPK